LSSTDVLAIFESGAVEQHLIDFEKTEQEMGKKDYEI